MPQPCCSTAKPQAVPAGCVNDTLRRCINARQRRDFGARVGPCASWPDLFRPSTSCFLRVATKDVDGRDKPGHDEIKMRAPNQPHLFFPINCQTATSLSPRGGNPPEVSGRFSRWHSPKARERVFHSRRRERSAERRNSIEACSCERARAGLSEDQLALRRSTCGVEAVGPSASAPCQGYYPLALARRRDGFHPKPLSGLGAFSTGLPGHGLRGHARGHRIPAHVRSPRNVPQASGDACKIARHKYQSR
jgi:hypothetical protein